MSRLQNAVFRAKACREKFPAPRTPDHARSAQNHDLHRAFLQFVEPGARPSHTPRAPSGADGHEVLITDSFWQSVICLRTEFVGVFGCVRMKLQQIFEILYGQNLVRFQ